MMDLTSIWSFYHQRQSLIHAFLIGFILFVVGWNLGRITSPYYAAQPIIFTDRACEACSTSGGSRGELEDLKTQGIAERSNPSATPDSIPSLQPAVAGLADPTPPTGTGKFVASVNSNLYHDSTCPAAKQIKPANQVWFDSVAAAEAAGYSPGKCTKEKLENSQ